MYSLKITKNLFLTYFGGCVRSRASLVIVQGYFVVSYDYKIEIISVHINTT